MKKLKKLSVLAMLVAVTAAFAFTPAKRLGTKYAYLSTNGSNYVISESLAGEVEGTHWLCNEAETPVCTFESQTAPNANKEIPISAANTIVSNREFVDLFTPADGDVD